MAGWFFASLRGYRVGRLPRDLVAGLMLAAIAIPGQLATARLAGMPPEAGLYAFAAGSLAFAAFGANRFMSVAADSTIAPIFAGGLSAVAVAGTPHYAWAVDGFRQLDISFCGPCARLVEARIAWMRKHLIDASPRHDISRQKHGQAAG